VPTITRQLGARRRCGNGNADQRITAQFANGNSDAPRNLLPLRQSFRPTHIGDTTTKSGSTTIAIPAPRPFAANKAINKKVQ
jgi:hypothetical protein